MTKHSPIDLLRMLTEGKPQTDKTSTAGSTIVVVITDQLTLHLGATPAPPVATVAE